MKNKPEKIVSRSVSIANNLTVMYVTKCSTNSQEVVQRMPNQHGLLIQL